MEEIQEINLQVDGQVFTVKKDILCEHSDYFRAMFSGHFIENEQRDVTIDVIEANLMNIILRYMDVGSIDLSEYSISEIRNLTVATNFLQVTELMKQIENCLDQQLTESNCMEIMDIAEQCSLKKLEHSSAAFGLLSFKSMKFAYIPTIDRLFWYLSHPYLDSDNEIDVFRFGLDWISHTETGSDALLIILGCLDVKRLTVDDLNQINVLIIDHKNSLAAKVINCLEWLCNCADVSLETVTTKRSILCDTFSERVYTETYNIVKECKERKLKYSPVIRANLRDFTLYTYTGKESLQSLLEIPLKVWSWSATAWGNTKLVVVGGTLNCIGMRTMSYMKDVLVYDTLKKKWINHGVELPPRRLAEVAVLHDSLFIVGGIHLDTAIVYNLKERTYKEIAKSPEGKARVKLCSHKGAMYAARYLNELYVYESSEQGDFWRELPMRPHDDYWNINFLISFNDYIYTGVKRHIQRFRPENDNNWELIRIYKDFLAMCSLKTQLLVFVTYHEKPKPGEDSEHNSIHKIQPIPYNIKPDITGSCLLVMDLPSSLRKKPSNYHKKYLSNYCNVYYGKDNE